MTPDKSKTHSLTEDLFALLVGTLFVGFGLILLKSHGMLTGGTAGLALVLAKLTGYSFGLIFFLINLPFYLFAVGNKGWRFVINTFVSVSCVSAWSTVLPKLVTIASIDPYLAAVMGGCLLGTGVLILFRHGSSLGGAGILALYLQDRHGMSAGRIQMSLDIAIVGIGFFLVSLPILAISILSVFALNLVIALNYKPGRYQIT